MENQIEEQQLDLFTDHLPFETMRANPLRLSFSAVAYVVMRALREFGLQETALGSAVRHDSGAIVEDRCLGPCRCASCVVSVASDVHASMCEPAAVREAAATGDRGDRIVE